MEEKVLKLHLFEYGAPGKNGPAIRRVF